MESVLPYLLGSTGALVPALLVAWAFYTGKLHSDREFKKVTEERDEYRAALETERKAVNEAAGTLNITNQLITALTQVATSTRGEDGGHHSSGSGRE